MVRPYLIGFPYCIVISLPKFAELLPLAKGNRLRRFRSSHLENIIAIEKELTKYKQMYQTTLDTALEMDDLKEAFALLDKYENMLRK